MDNSSVSGASVLGFGVFELDCQTGELRRLGVLVHLPPQPFKILSLLAGYPGQVVTREDIRQQVWGEETYVDFERGLNQCISQIRTALGDDAEAPRYIETLPRRGYRFIAPVETVASHVEAVRGPLRYKRWVVGVGGGAVAFLALLLALNVAGLRNHLLGHATGPPRIHSIAVLPLENLSRDPDQEYFADGMTEELITDLGKISALRVISRTSAMHYRGTKKTLPEIARELHVDGIVEGTVERSGNRVRITANLLYAPTDRHMWAQTYERDLGDVLSLQDEVARTIARQIKIKLTPQEHARLASARRVDPEAYELYLRSRYQANEYPREEIMKAVGYAQQAIQEDPASALGYSALALAYMEVSYRGFLPFGEAFPKARAAALKALEIDDTLAAAHISLGEVKFQYEWDWLGTERELKRAIELNPDDAEAHHFYGNVLNSMGHLDEGLAEVKRAYELDPFSANISDSLASHYVATRHYDQAIDQARKTLEIDPNFREAYVQIWRAYLGKGKYEEAVATIENIPGSSDVEWAKSRAALLAVPYALAGRGKEATEMLAEASPEKDPLWCAEAYDALGELNQAFAVLDKAYEQHSSGLLWIQSDPAWDPLRSDPRFQALLRRMNFPR